MKLGLHRHYKGGFYNVLHTASNANSHEMERGALTIVYQVEGGEQVYTRDYTEFAAGVDFHGERVARFRYVGEDPSIATHERFACSTRLLYREAADGQMLFFSPGLKIWIKASYTKAQLVDELGLKLIDEKAQAV